MIGDFRASVARNTATPDSPAPSTGQTTTKRLLDRKQQRDIADCVARSYDVEGMTVGTVAAGRIGLAVLKRLKPFDMKLHYTDRHRLPETVEKELGLTYHPTVKERMVKVCDVITINCPLHPETEHMFNDALIAKMKRGAYLVNTARRKICDRNAIVRALRAAIWRAMPATCGSRSPRRRINPGAPCRITA